MAGFETPAALHYLRVLISGTFQTSVRCLNCEKQQGSWAHLASRPVLTAGCFSAISSAVRGGAGGVALSLPFSQERFACCETSFEPWSAPFGAGGPDPLGGGGAHLHLGFDPSHGKGWRPAGFPPSPFPQFKGAAGLLCQVCMGFVHPWDHGMVHSRRGGNLGLCPAHPHGAAQGGVAPSPPMDAMPSPV